MQLDDTVVLVTGGASGLGRGICQVLGERGADLAVADIDLEGATRVAEEVGRDGRRARAFKVDVTGESDVKDLAEAAIDAFGRIDVLVNSAGVIAAPGFEDTTGHSHDSRQGVEIVP